MISLEFLSPNDVLKAVASKAKNARLSQNLTQEGLAARSGVSLGTLKLFERTGKASFETVVKIAFVLDAMREFELLFPVPDIVRIEDVVEKPQRKRGRRK